MTYAKIAALCCSLILFMTLSSFAQAAMTKGIYVTQYTAQDTKYFNYLIDRAKKSGINTFIVDVDFPSKYLQTNLALLKANNISFVARITMFPEGGTREQIVSQAYWEKKYKLVELALSYGAEQIQLDYIRYKASQAPSSKNAEDVNRVIAWFKNKLAAHSVPLQIDVFGIASFGESKYIGQNIKLFAPNVNAMCPMVYPSHYEPYKLHAVKPYDTVYDSLQAIKAQFAPEPVPFKLYPYIELSNYRYKLSQQKKLDYIYAQIQAAENAGANGWYAWSPHNRYDNLFNVLETRSVK